MPCRNNELNGSNYQMQCKINQLNSTRLVKASELWQYGSDYQMQCKINQLHSTRLVKAPNQRHSTLYG
jgi:hypothetical protein